MVQTLIVVLLSLIGNGDITAAEVYEVSELQPGDYYYGDNWQFEDGSYVATFDSDTYSGCIPFMLCSWVGVDTPWEDILNEADAEYMYKIIDMYKNRPEKFKLFATNFMFAPDGNR